jgi:hypothetical protein
MAAAGLMMLGISTVIAVTGGFKSESANKRSVPPDNIARPAPSNHLTLQTNHQTVPALSVELNQPTSVDPTDTQKVRAPGLTTDQVRVRPTTKPKVPFSDNSSEETAPAFAKTETRAPIGDKVSNTIGQSVDVVMQIENGRVLRASIANPTKGMDGYEALALRIARQRRYPGKKSGEETVKIRVSPQD